MKTIEKITWETWEPIRVEDFPCMICGRAIAKVVVIIDNVYRLSVCSACSQLPEDIIMAKARAKKEL